MALMLLRFEVWSYLATLLLNVCSFSNVILQNLGTTCSFPYKNLISYIIGQV